MCGTHRRLPESQTGLAGRTHIMELGHKSHLLEVVELPSNLEGTSLRGLLASHLKVVKTMTKQGTMTSHGCGHKLMEARVEANEVTIRTRDLSSTVCTQMELDQTAISFRCLSET